jgi:hypothetical protein
MGQHFSKRRRKTGKENIVSPTTVTLKEKLIDELIIMHEQLDELKNIKSEQHRPHPDTESKNNI